MPGPDTNQAQLKYLWDEKDDVDFFRSVAAFAKEQKNADSVIAPRVHAIALREVNSLFRENPKGGVFRAAALRKYIDTTLDEVKATGSAIDLAVFGYSGKKGDEDRITGNGAFANAYKAVFNAVSYGADLTKVQTVSACKKFAKEAADEERKARTKSEMWQAAEIDLMLTPEWMGKDVEGEFKDEFRKAVTRRVDQAMNQQTQSRAEGDEKVFDDVFEAQGKLLASMARQYAETDYETALEMMRGLEGRFEKLINALLQSAAEQQLSKAG